jgi:hypothetical protein
MEWEKGPPRRNLAATRARQAKQAAEGSLAREEYAAKLEHERDKTTRLRALRLATESEESRPRQTRQPRRAGRG